MAQTSYKNDVIFDGGVRVANGTAALPALSFSGDTDTGVHSAGADALGLSAGGAVRLTVGTSSITVNSLPITGVTNPTNPQDVATKSYVDDAVAAAGGGAGQPIGSVAAFAGPETDIPSGWLLCDGSPVGRSAYPRLFALIGTTFGPGDGSTTFNLPDLRGRVPVGVLGMNYLLGATGGASTHTLTIEELPSHTHSNGTLTAASAGAHAHSVLYGSNGVQPVGSNAPRSNAADVTGTTQSAGAHTHNVTGATSATGSGIAHNNMQPYQVLNYIICAESTDGEGSGETFPLLAPSGTASSPVYSFTSDPDTGVFRSAADTLNISTGGISRFALSATALTTTLPLRGQNGTAAAPALSFSGDTNTGIYSAGADSLGLSAGGTVRLTVGTTAIAVNSLPITGVANPTNPQDAATKSYVDSAVSGGVSFPLLAPLGDVSAPSYSFATQTGTGIYATDTGVGVATFGQPAARFDAGGIVVPWGSASAPSLSFEELAGFGPGTGIYNNLGLLGFTVNGTHKAYFTETALSLNSLRITGVSSPTSDDDAATKGYVDNLPRGIVARGTSSAQYTALVGATIICNAPLYNYVPGRRYKASFTIYGAMQSDTVSRFNIGFENAASTTYGEGWIGRFLGQAQSYTWVTYFTVPSAIGMATRVRFSRRDGSGNATLFVGARDSYSTELVVEDIGPA